MNLYTVQLFSSLYLLRVQHQFSIVGLHSVLGVIANPRSIHDRTVHLCISQLGYFCVRSASTYYITNTHSTLRCFFAKPIQ